MALFGEAYWPGIRGFISCEYTCSHGSRPGIASLQIPEQRTHDIVKDGDLVITDGARRLVLKSCRVMDIQYSGGSADTPRTMTLQIADRRWMWAYGAISGKFNQMDPDPDPTAAPLGEEGQAVGLYIPGTERTAATLMTHCFQELNWTRFRLDPAPLQPVSVQWDDESPANALQEVSDAIGYRISYRPWSDHVLVSPVGVGMNLPLDLPVIVSTPGFKLPTAPAAIWIAGGPTRYRDWLPLESVGLEADGRWRPIDDLSYKPAGGWTTVGPWFNGVEKGDSASIEESVKLAKEHVYRTFRVKMQDVQDRKDGHLTIGGYGRVYQRRLIRLEDREYRVEKLKNGRRKVAQPMVIGSVLLSRLRSAAKLLTADRLGNTEIKDALPLSFAIDRERGHVRFDDYVVRLDGAKKVMAPVLYLSTSFQILRTTFVPERYQYIGGNVKQVPGCPPEVIRKPDVVQLVYATRGFRGGPGQADTPLTLLKTETSKADCDKAAKFYADANLAKYLVAGEAQDITYAGIWPIDPDGLRQQVTWRVGGGQPATTRATTNTEHALELPRYPEKRRIEQIQGIIKAYQRIDRSGMPS